MWSGLLVTNGAAAVHPNLRQLTTSFTANKISLIRGLNRRPSLSGQVPSGGKSTMIDSRIRAIGMSLLLVAAAFSQSDRGTLTGTVTDPANAVVPAAKLTARNVETGGVFETVTTPTGNYTLTSLPIGTYDLTAESPGFSKKTQTGIRIQVAQTTRMDVSLQVGTATESVTVSS